MPLLMVLAEWRWRRTGSAVHLDLARRWAKGVAILFAVGAVSGTVISFELGLLWPRFMAFAGPIIGMPFSLEGFAFFAEAIFLGIYLYGWGRVGPRLHLASGVLVAVSGAASAFFVTLANAWMNVPAGFELTGRRRRGRPAVRRDVPAGLGARGGARAPLVLRRHRLRGRRDPRARASCAAPAPRSTAPRSGSRSPSAARAALLQPLSGDFSARQVAQTQPVKLAALEGQFRTERGAPLRIGGLPGRDPRVHARGRSRSRAASRSSRSTTPTRR